MISGKGLKTIFTGGVIMAAYLSLVLAVNPSILKFHTDAPQFADDFAALLYTLPILACLVCAYIVFLNRAVIAAFVKRIDRRYIVALFVVATIFVLACSLQGFNFKFFSPSDAEWNDLNAARNLSMGDKTAFFDLVDRIMPVLSYAIGFRVFGFTPLVGSIFSLAAGALSIFLVFLLTQLLFGDPRISFISAILYAFNVYTLIFTSVRMGNTILVTFFVLLFLASAVWAFQRHSFSFHVMSVAFFTLVNQTKPEFFVLIGAYAACFLLFKEFKHFSLRQLVVLLGVFLMFSVPFFMTNHYYRMAAQNGWCSFPSQPFHDGNFHSVFSPVVGFLDTALQFVMNGRFSFYYFFGDIPTFFVFWGSAKMLLIGAAIVSGFMLSFREHEKNAILFILFFSSMTFVYLADCVFYEDRLAFPTYAMVIAYSGFFVASFSRLLRKVFGGREGVYSVLVVVLLLLSSAGGFIASFLSWTGSDGQPLSLARLSFRATVDYYGDMKSIMRQYRFSPRESYFVVPNHEEQRALNFLGYRAVSLSDLFDESFFNDRDGFLKRFTLPRDPSLTNYFIKSPHCSYLQEMGILCDVIEKHYAKERVGQWGRYDIYRLE